MPNLSVWIAIGVPVLLAALYFVMRKMSGPKPKTPASLKAGQPLPAFEAVDEDGNSVNSGQLAGAPAVILFIRGNWCPFCTRQVEDLVQHYKEIVDLGARLIFVTPRPLATTRRVADFFGVSFEFWLDDSLQIAHTLGLVHPSGVPKDQRKIYGEDTVWPTALVVDSQGVIRLTRLSNFIFDRPKPQALLQALKKL